MPASAVFGIVEMQMRFATGDVTPPLGASGDQGNNHIVDKVCGCERHVLWQKVQQGAFIRAEEERQDSPSQSYRVTHSLK
jgi:hypothetical protein